MGKKRTSPQDIQDRKKKIRVALLCIAGILIFYIGANFLKGVNVFHKKTYFYCVMDDADGVQQNTAIMLGGYKVGMVQKVELLEANPPRICAQIMLNENIDIPNDSKLQIVSSGLLGGMQLNLLMGQSGSFFRNEDTIPCSKAPGMLDGIDDMKSQIASVLASVDTIGLELKDVLHKDGGGEDLRATLSNIEDATANLNELLAQNKSKVGNVVSSLERFGKTLDAASPQLTSILQNFDDISDTIAKAEIAQVINNANEAIREVEHLVAKVNRGEGTVGNLMSDDGVAKKLDASINSLNELLIDLKAHPKRYVHFSLFGKKDKEKDKEKK